MSQIVQGVIELSVAGVVILLYWSCAMYKKGDCDLKKLAIFAVNLLGTMTGVFIFLGAFDVMKTSVQNGVWGGVAGLCITLVTAQELIREFRVLFTKEVEPKKTEDPSSTSIH